MAFCQAGPGSSRALQSPGCTSPRGPRSRAQGSSQSVSSDHWLHLLLLRTLADLCVKDVSTALVNDVEALGAVQNLRDFLDSILV